MRPKRILAVALAAALALVLLYFLLPRSLSQVMGGGFDPARVDRVEVLLSKTDAHEPGEHASTPLSDEASHALLEKLNSRSYFLLPGSKPYWEITLGYEVHLSFSYSGYTQYASLSFCGGSELEVFSTARPRTRTIRVSGDGEAFQREVLELLLETEVKEAQPTAVPPFFI